MKPFLLNRKSHDSAPLRPLAVPPSLPARGHAHALPGGAAEPATVLEVIKDGDKVVRIVVTCACGERIEVNCLYPANG